MSEKFIGKMMRLAKLTAEDNNPCYARQVGCVIATPDGRVLSLGYNGPPTKSPHCDSKDYIQDILWPKLTSDEKLILQRIALEKVNFDRQKIDEIGMHEVQFNYEPGREVDGCVVGTILDGCKTCPRRLLNNGPGTRLDLCSCQHAERNAITNARGSVEGGVFFGWCVTSCWECTGALINARVKEVHFLEGEEYSKGVWALYKSVNIPVFLHSIEEFLDV